MSFVLLETSSEPELVKYKLSLVTLIKNILYPLDFIIRNKLFTEQCPNKKGLLGPVINFIQFLFKLKLMPLLKGGSNFGLHIFFIDEIYYSVSVYISISFIKLSIYKVLYNHILILSIGFIFNAAYSFPILYFYSSLHYQSFCNKFS